MQPRLSISRHALKANIQHIKARTSSSFLCPMVKANAYGIGEALVVSELLEAGVKHLGVSRVEEGLRLRRLFPTSDFKVLVFFPVGPDQLKSILESSLTLVVGSEKDLEALRVLSAQERADLEPVHLKFDLGMSRLGFSQTTRVEDLVSKVKNLGLKVEGVLGHLPAPSVLSEKTEVINLLEDVAKSFGVSTDFVHIPNSASLALQESSFGVRPGLSLFVPPSEKEVNFKMSLSLEAPLARVFRICKGESVSYNGTWTADKNGYIGILPIGYADGLRRGLSNRIRVKFGAEYFDQVGTICMDYAMISLGENTKMKVGDYVCLFDSSFPALYRWADLLGSIPYEILTGLGDRIERRLV